MRDAGGIPMVFLVHPIQEDIAPSDRGPRPHLPYLGLVELLAGYPFDGVVLTTGCDKTTPVLMAAATVDLPAIVINGGPDARRTVRGTPGRRRELPCGRPAAGSPRAPSTKAS